LEAELKKKPGNAALLHHLVSYYSHSGRSQAKLHTYVMQLVESHPDVSDIYFRTVTSFYIHPDFRDEVIVALESQAAKSPKVAGIYWNLAQIYSRKAIPPFAKDASEQEKQKWFQYYGVPADTPIPTEIDHEAAAKSEDNYRKAIAIAKDDKFYFSFYSGQLAELLIDLDRGAEAIPVLEKAIAATGEEYRAELHNSLGDLYAEQGNDRQAKAQYLKAIATDKLSDEETGCQTVHAYTELGLIALKQQDFPEAEQMLLKSAEPDPCCHTKTRGMPLRLAEALINKGYYSVPRQYLETVLNKFTPERREVIDLLARAKSGAKGGRQSAK
jgi:tetratricopeptide (TPR) repeat protein